MLVASGYEKFKDESPKNIIIASTQKDINNNRDQLKSKLRRVGTKILNSTHSELSSITKALTIEKNNIDDKDAQLYSIEDAERTLRHLNEATWQFVILENPHLNVIVHPFFA